MTADLDATADDLGSAEELARQASQRPAGEVAPELPDYQVDAVLGKGAFGVCWSATHRRTGQRVAIKVLQVAAGKEPAQVAAEIRHMVQAGRHPHVLEVLDARVEGRTVQIVAPLCAQSLGQRLQQGPIPWKQALEWLNQAAQALHLLHRCDLIHCDIKPDNLLLDGRDRLLVADLGQTRARGAGGLRTGSFFYMPSQQAQDSRPQVAWDVYALGATFYHLLTGAPPRSQAPWRIELAQGTPAERMDLYAAHLVRTPLREMEGVPAELEELLEWLLEIEPERRCPDMGALLDRLKELRAPQPVATRTWIGPAVFGVGLLALPWLVGQLAGELGWWLGLSLGAVGRFTLYAGACGAVGGGLLALVRYR